MRCPDDGVLLHELTPDTWRCPRCRGLALTRTALQDSYPHVASHLTRETDPECGAFAHARRCARCEGETRPERIADLPAWLDRCPDCSLFWAESLDVRVLAGFQEREERRRRLTVLQPEERAELAASVVEEGQDPLRRLKDVLDFFGLNPDGHDDEDDD